LWRPRRAGGKRCRGGGPLRVLADAGSARLRPAHQADDLLALLPRPHGTDDVLALLAQGLITQDEHDAKKREILARL